MGADGGNHVVGSGDPAAKRKGCCIRFILGVDFSVDIGDMSLYGPHAQEELLCDLPVAHAPRDEPEDLKLAFRET